MESNRPCNFILTGRSNLESGLNMATLLPKPPSRISVRRPLLLYDCRTHRSRHHLPQALQLGYLR